jgi:hypothetical protein
MAITVADTAPVQAVTLGRRVITALLIVAAARDRFFPPLATIRNCGVVAVSRSCRCGREATIHNASLLLYHDVYRRPLPLCK